MDERSDLRVCLATLLQQLRHSYAQVDFTGSALGDLAAVPSNLLMKDLFQGFLPLTQKDNFEDIAVSSGTLGGASRRGGVNVKKFVSQDCLSNTPYSGTLSERESHTWTQRTRNCLPAIVVEEVLAHLRFSPLHQSSRDVIEGFGGSHSIKTFYSSGLAHNWVSFSSRAIRLLFPHVETSVKTPCLPHLVSGK